MMRFRSSSSPSRSGALALTLLLAGGGCLAEWAEDDAHVDLRVDQPGGLGFEIEVSGRNRDELFLYLDAHLTNLGAEPCHVAIFLHTSEPVREDMPALSGPPAPVVAGARLIFETVLAPPSEGREFTRDLDAVTLMADRLAGGGELRRWLTISTCAAPDLQVQLGLDLQLLYLARRPGDRRAAIDQLWP